VIVALIGAGLLAIVVLYLPFLQTHFARENRFAALFEIKAVRGLFRRAPIAFWIALLITLLFALPLYLLKIQLTPREVAWLPSLLFVIFIFPARLLTGWAVGRADRREPDQPRHWTFRWLSRLAGIPVVAAYAMIVFVTQYLSWHGSMSLLEQHAFLVPAPLMGL
jgi:purine-cytosine permease-like protein